MVVELRGVVRTAYRADRDGPWRNLTLAWSGAVLQQRAGLRRARLHRWARGCRATAVLERWWPRRDSVECGRDKSASSLQLR